MSKPAVTLAEVARLRELASSWEATAEEYAAIIREVPAAKRKLDEILARRKQTKEEQCTAIRAPRFW